MILHRNADGSYKEITTIKTKDGSNIGKIVGKDGNIYFTSTVNATAEGYPCILPKSVGNDTVDYSIYGNSVQDGTPSPENPVEVESVGDKTKNLFSGFIKGIKLDSTTGEEQLSSVTATTDYIKVVSEFSYFLSGLDINLYSFVAFYDENKNYLYRSSAGAADARLLNIDSDTRYVRITQYENVGTTGTIDDIDSVTPQLELGTAKTSYEPYGYKIPVVTRGKNLVNISSKTGTQLNNFYASFGESQEIADIFNHNIGETFSFSYTLSDPNFLQEMVVYYTDSTYKTVRNTILIEKFVIKVELRARSDDSAYKGTNVEMSDFQLEYGSEATAYEPYKEPVTTNIYLDEPIRKIGDYADVLNFGSQTVTRNIKNLWLTSDMNWSLHSINDHGIANFGVSIVKATSKKLIRSNRFNEQPGTIGNTVTEGFYMNTASDRLYIRISQEKASTVEEFKQYLDENPTYIDYTVLTAEVNSVYVPSIPTFKGTTVITTDTEVEPSNMEITYKARR